MSKKLDLRDISPFLQKIREVLLGRVYNAKTSVLRFPPLVAPRTIPAPDLPNGPYDKHSGRYYYARHAMDSVRPPVVAPIAEGPSLPNGKGPAPSDAVNFSEVPTPGPSWWWDGHCYYEERPDPVRSQCQKNEKLTR